jgi:nucleoside-diphosphate-sugar epimerase
VIAVEALVTGGGGFLGRYIVEALVHRGTRVRIYGRRQYPFAKELGASCYVGDITDLDRLREATRGVDVVYHTVAIAGIWGKWQDYYATNTVGTQRVIEACLANNVPKLVFTSSPSVTFGGSPQEGVDETEPYPKKFLCAYPQTKAMAEQLVLQANDPSRLLTCSLRPHLIWGPRDGHLIPRLIERAKSGQLRQVGDGQNLVDMIYVENAARAHLQAADALSENGPVAGSAYFLSQGKPVNCWGWINEILELAGVEPVKKRIGFRAAWTLGSLMELVYRLLDKNDEPRMTRFLAAQLALPHYFSIDRAQRDFGYSPEISKEEGMERLARWIHENRD